MIKCGHCEGRHETVAQVRECQAFESHRPPTRPSEPDWMRTDYGSEIIRTSPPSSGTDLRFDRALVTQDGMYRAIIEDPHNEGTTGEIWKVQWNRAGGDGRRLYAKVLTDEPRGEWHFEYVPGGILKLRPEDRMTLEEAQQFGKLYGVCCVCGRTLTDEISIEAGIGPVCAGRV